MNINNLISNIYNASSSKKSELIKKVISQNIINGLSNGEIYGYLLINLNRVCNYNINSAFALKWEQDNLLLAYNPNKFVNNIKSNNDLTANLEHLSMHIIWLHPIRYNNPNKLESIATDISVNQYVKHLPHNAFTIDKLSYLYNIKLPNFKDSNEYIKLLSQFFAKNNDDKNFNDSNMQLMDDHKAFKKATSKSDSKYSKLRNLIKHTVDNMGNKNRGRLPNSVNQQLDRIINKQINWRKYIQKGISKIPFSKSHSIKRFNRRQSYRMELPGKISSTLRSIIIFVDNSGSVSNNDLTSAIRQISNIFRAYPLDIIIYPFDSKVHERDAYRVNSAQNLRYKRVANGGTSYQAIFEFIHNNHLGNNFCIIFTDGLGEKIVNNHGFNNVLWVLEKDSDNLSINKKIGNVIKISNIN
ncbi:VWA-like domain-containing protein [Apilactobacillus quenuiae]|uniref:VWA-like domain-containing protein n=1 Tax=Apilactobacillus quenuiae TaxID=2008377 RepID=UPI000D01F1B3|nr:VWA-like domain-containing protein [Apilactobacillus quenuiae]